MIGALEIQQLAAAKLVMLLALSGAVVLYWKKARPVWWMCLLSLLNPLVYLVLIWGSKLAWSGLQGDELFVAAFLERVAGGHPFSDFYYAGLPPFYPSLYFWAVGGLGWIFHLSGVRAAQLGALLVLLLTPWLVYVWHRRHPNANAGTGKVLHPILAAALVLAVAEWPAVINKPYEFFAAIATTLWTVALITELEAGTLTKKRIVGYGVVGGLLAMLYYLWLIPAGLALVLSRLFSRGNSRKFWPALLGVAGVSVLVSLPFTLPLGLSYARLGVENWQPGFFIPQDLYWFIPFLTPSVFGLVALVGLISLVWFWDRLYMRSLGFLLLSTYAWQAISFFTIMTAQAPMLPSKPFLFLGGSVFSLAAAYGLAQVSEVFLTTEPRRRLAFAVFLGVLASQMLGGRTIDDSAVITQLRAANQPLRSELSELRSELAALPNLSSLTVLSSGVPQLSAYLPLNLYISHNIHYSHPAAHFSDRFEFVRRLAASPDPEAFAKTLEEAPHSSIDALLLYKAEGDSYPIFFWLDAYPNGGREGSLTIPKRLITDEHFTKLFEDKHFVFYQPK